MHGHFLDGSHEEQQGVIMAQQVILQALGNNLCTWPSTTSPVFSSFSQQAQQAFQVPLPLHIVASNSIVLCLGNVLLHLEEVPSSSWRAAELPNCNTHPHTITFKRKPVHSNLACPNDAKCTATPIHSLPITASRLPA
eukprot:5392252-Amphidinium_carterae.1